MDYTALWTLLGGSIAAYFSYRIGKLQISESRRSTQLVDKTTGETEFRKSLLELIDQQEDKLTRQDTKIEKLDGQIEQSKKLTDELKAANFNLSIENQRLTRTVETLEAQLSILRSEVTKLKQQQLEQDKLNDANR